MFRFYASSAQQMTMATAGVPLQTPDTIGIFVTFGTISP
jgi:hypothetical protein